MPIGHPNEEQMNKYAKKVLIPTGTWLDVLGLAIQSGCLCEIVLGVRNRRAHIPFISNVISNSAAS